MTGGVEAPNAAGYTGGLVPVSILRLRSVSLAGGLIARQHTAAAKRHDSLALLTLLRSGCFDASCGPSKSPFPSLRFLVSSLRPSF